MLHFDKPMIAAIHGYALGAGCEMTMYCDLRLASDDARFGLPEVHVGLFPMQVLAVLRDRIAPAHLRELCLTGNAIDAPRAHAIGLINRVVPLADLDGAVEETLSSLLAVSSSFHDCNRRIASSGVPCGGTIMSASVIVAKSTRTSGASSGYVRCYSARTWLPNSLRVGNHG